MNLSLLAAYFAAIFLLIATPGPVVVVVANTAARFGARRALLTALGSNGASLLLIGIAALVVTGLFAVDMRLLQWIGLLGCLFIGRMAIVSLYEDLSARPPDAQPVAPSQKRSAIANGFLVGIANPKDIIFFVAFFPQFIAVTPSVGVSLTLLTALWVLADFAILLAYITLLSGTALQRARRAISVLSALLLLGVAVVGAGYALWGLLD
ncbi:LysE-type translocator [Serratia marcescens subsp. marcescens Db11]|uniref:LysE-type translocator n=1 Tax=Serratia marcescens subsp. marcescens Db11 TaxID=273526 RepID=A0ABC9IPV4_SERMA|nr:LysE family translocator [Serratia marcescens]CDG14760.1 LysE-type translocator [Serratia marcescens subsp. marcescens Db11]